MNCLRKMTFLPLEQIDEMGTWKDAKLNEAKDILAWSSRASSTARRRPTRPARGARAVFAGGDTEHMPTTELTADDLTDGAIDVLSLLVKTGLCSSRSDAPPQRPAGRRNRERREGRRHRQDLHRGRAKGRSNTPPRQKELQQGGHEVKKPAPDSMAWQNSLNREPVL